MIIAGVDEVGRGPLAGPVTAAAVILNKDNPIQGLKDSKKLTKKAREKLFPLINEKAISVGIGSVDVETIDKINIREATFVAMNSAIENLSVTPEKILIDGEPLRDQKITNEGVVGGDDKVDSIRAASIIAKVTRDRLMLHYSKIFPEYGFEKNSGYGTKQHLDALKIFKATPIHRRSFGPVKNSMPSIIWLEKEGRIEWMMQKLAALYLKRLNYEIIQMNKTLEDGTEFNIIAHFDQQRIFIQVFPFSLYEGDFDSTKKIKAKNNIESINEEDEYFGKHRLDYIFVKLNRNNAPKIKHLKGIQLT